MKIGKSDSFQARETVPYIDIELVRKLKTAGFARLTYHCAPHSGVLGIKRHVLQRFKSLLELVRLAEFAQPLRESVRLEKRLAGGIPAGRIFAVMLMSFSSWA